MDHTRIDKQRKATRDLCAKMSLEELSYALGRYCGPSNTGLCEKKYGFILSKDIVEQELQTRTFEDAIFGTET